MKLKAVLNDKLISILPKYTNLPPAKAAKLISNAISEKAHLSLKGEDDISLHDVLDNAIPLKKNATELQTFEGLVSDIAKEYELPVALGPGVKKIETNRTVTTTKKTTNQKYQKTRAYVSSIRGCNRLQDTCNP